MNLTASTSSVLTPDSKPGRAEYMVVAGMLVYSLLTFFVPAAKAGIGATMATAAVGYFLVIYLYFGIARLTLSRSSTLLWVGLVAAVVISYLGTGMNEMWMVLTTWGMLMFGGVVVGRVSVASRSWSKAYAFGTLAVALFAIAQFAPLWNELIRLATENTSTMMKEMESNLLTMGYSAEAIKDSLYQTNRFMDGLIRLLPAALVMAAITQFSIGFMIFARWSERNVDSAPPLEPYTRWKMPFWITPALIVIIAVRMTAAEPWIQVADNFLLALSIGYSITGLSLIQSYLGSLGLSRLMKVLFYIFLFFTQLVGFFVTVLLGFADSFFDWRRIHRPAAESN